MAADKTHGHVSVALPGPLRLLQDDNTQAADDQSAEVSRIAGEGKMGVEGEWSKEERKCVSEGGEDER